MIGASVSGYWAVLLSALVCTVGCETSAKLTSEELTKAELAGPAPTKAQIEADIKGVYKSRLFDPYSAVYEFGEPFKGKTWGGAFGGGWKYGDIVNYTVNAKNRFGGYVGATPGVALWQNGRFIGVKEAYVPR